MKSHGGLANGMGHDTEHAIVPIYANVLGLNHG
jgi:hypothetical protein